MSPRTRKRCRRIAPAIAVVALIVSVLPWPAVDDAAQAARRPDTMTDLEDTQVLPGDKLVRKLQQLLTDIGIYRGPISGYTNKDLESAIRRYQRYTGRRVTGKVTQELVDHIDTQSRVGVMLRRLEKTRERSKEAARQALLGNSETRDLISNDGATEVADPTRDPTPCFRNPTTACLLAEAVESAKAIAKPELRDWALGEILVSQAKAGFLEDAVATVRRIGDARLIIVALRDIARAQATAGQVDDALNAAAIIPDDFKRLEALAAVAGIYLRRGQTDSAMETAGRIAYEARKLSSPLQRVTLMAQMAVVFTKVGNPQGGERLLRDAQEIVRSSAFAREKGRTERGAALRHVAAAFSEIGQPAQALSIMEDVTGTYDRTAVLMSAATALAEAGDITAALDTAQLIDESRYKSVVLGRIAVRQAKQRDDAAADKTIELALEEAHQVKMPYARSYAVGQLTLSLIRIGAIRNDGTLAKAVETAGGIENERLRAYTLWTAATLQAKQGKAAEAAKTVALAEAATDEITSTLSRVWMFGDLASEHADAGDLAAAKEAFARGLKIAEDINNSWSRARALAKMAGVLQDLH